MISGIRKTNRKISSGNTELSTTLWVWSINAKKVKHLLS